MARTIALIALAAAAALPLAGCGKSSHEIELEQQLAQAQAKTDELQGQLNKAQEDLRGYRTLAASTSNSQPTTTIAAGDSSTETFGQPMNQDPLVSNDNPTVTVTENKPAG